jgi:uncharacterized membrane protein HdeD (DUF308 family)
MSTDDHDDRDSTVDRAEARNGAPERPSDERRYSRSQRSLAANRLTIMLAGVLVAVLGIVAILAPYVTGITLSLVFGALLVLGGLVNAAAAFSAKAWNGAIFGVFLAVLYGFAGIAMLANPSLGLVALTLLLGVYFLVEGALQLVMGLRLRSNENWGWLLAAGIVSVLFSSLILIEFPTSADWAVGLLFGVNLLTSGIALALVATAAPSSKDIGAARPVGEPETGSS